MGMISELLPQVSALEIEYNTTVNALVSGDPSYMDHIHGLVASAKKLFASFKQMIEQMKTSTDTITTIDKVSAIAMHQNPAAVASARAAISKSTAYFIKEISAAISLFNSLMRLITNILGLQPILAVLINQLNSLKAATSAQVVKAQNLLRISKQRADKALQWAAEAAQITSDELLEKSILALLNATYAKTADPEFRSRLEIQIADSNFVLAVAIPAKRKQLADDKQLWESRWSDDESKNRSN